MLTNFSIKKQKLEHNGNTRFFKGLSAIGIDPSQNWTFFYVHFLKAKKTFEKKKVVF